MENWPNKKETEEILEEWGVVGLLHDFNYERYPNLKDHPFKRN